MNNTEIYAIFMGSMRLGMRIKKKIKRNIE